MFISETKTADKCPSFSNQIHYHMQHEFFETLALVWMEYLQYSFDSLTHVTHFGSNSVRRIGEH
jgi:uncharacterized phage-associated protein